MDANSDPGSRRPWTDLPLDILASIAIRLSLLELLSFRGTCKDFRSASSPATAKIQSSKQPWLLLQKTNDSKCILYDNQDSKTYNLKIPDLDGAICLASYQGWLLLFKNKSIYFFSPFPGYKITLPEFPHMQIEKHVGAFSHPPTSPDCMITIINPIGSSFEINMLSIGGDTWTRYTRSEYFDVKPMVSAATFDHTTNTFYYMHGTDSVLTFSATDKKWQPYNIVSGEPKKKYSKYLPYVYRENVFLNAIGDEKVKQLLDVEDDEYVDVCGLTHEPENSLPIVYKNETLNFSNTKTRMRKAVWIEPRFYEVRASG
ncbi:hypothetical protein R6Q59_026114 [Mikania micrantha]